MRPAVYTDNGGVAHRGFAAWTGLEPPSPSVSTLEEFKSLTTLSLNSPIVVYCTASNDSSVDPGLVSAVHGAGGSVKLARLDAGSKELAPLAGQLHITSLPATILLFGGRLMDSQPGAPSGAALRDYIAQIQRLVDDVAAHRAKQAPAGEAPAVAPAELLAQGYAALLDPDQVVTETSLPLFQQVLDETSTASDMERAKAFSGAARCALLVEPADPESAEALLTAARGAVAEDKWPPEVASAAAFLELARDHSAILQAESEASDAAAAPEAPGKAQEAKALVHLAHHLFSQRQYPAALDAALRSVRTDRGWGEEAARKLLLRMFVALGADQPAVLAARSRLTNIWFI